MKVHAIQTGWVRIKTAQIEARGSDAFRMIAIFADPNWTDWVPTFVWLVEHEEGLIVVDTGQGAHLLKHGRSLHPYVRWEIAFRIEPEQEIGPQLKALGIGTRDVAKVVLTHLHMDHDGGLRHFPDSEIMVARGELASAKGLMGTLNGYLSKQWPSWFEPVPFDLSEERIGPFPGSRRITKAGDVVAVATPGHTANHVSVVVHDGDTAFFLAGDTSYRQDLMLAAKIDGISPNAAMTRATLAAIKEFSSQQATVYLPTHDPESSARLAERRKVFTA